MLSRRPSYQKIFSDLSGEVMSSNAMGPGQVPLENGTSLSLNAFQNISMCNGEAGGGTMLQYPQSQDTDQYFVPGNNW